VGKVIVLISKFKLRLGLFSKLYLTVVLTTIVLVWIVSVVSDYVESSQSVIVKEHRDTLRKYAQQASLLIKSSDVENLEQWVSDLKEKEKTMVAILKTTPHWLLEGAEKEMFDGVVDLTIGRHLDYPIHLYFSDNPFMKIPIPDSKYNLMIQLPQHMRPGQNWHIFDTVIRLGFPVLLVALICLLIYRNIILPLRSLQSASNEISKGDFDIRLDSRLTRRQDELGDLAISFNAMVKKIGVLVGRQRQLIQDISHELRTPITRINLLLDGEKSNSTLVRIQQEVNGMQSLLEDTLTLSWLNNEKAQQVKESVDLTLLIDSICDDACFEFSHENIVQDTPESCVIHNSNHRAVGQALENIIRNALKYTDVGTEVRISVGRNDSENGPPSVQIRISDRGAGVKDEFLEEIFEPFFRVDSARDSVISGYGLGLALAKRQIQVVGGSIFAQSNQPQGLVFMITLPVSYELLIDEPALS
jgi:two-component system sensor histidine kinase PfeS